MIGVDPADSNTHALFHVNQVNDVQTPPLCILKKECYGMRHVFNECPNVASNEHYYSEWVNWARIQERLQTEQWDNHCTMIQVNPPGTDPSTLYTICNDRIETTSPDARLHEDTGLTNELKRSADFNIEIGDPMDLGTLLAHAFPARMVARMRKRPLTTTPVEDNFSKKRKTFVTNDKGAVIATGFQNGIPRQNTVYPKTADASQN